MLISHEVPLSIIEKSKQFNDYDYCLLHLTYTHPEYKQFFINSRKEGRLTLLDNSLFELGEALTNEQLAAGVNELKPTWYVVPDCLDDKDATILRFKNFKKDYPKLPGVCIGVVQGRTLDELIECYKFMSEHADKIAIPFDSMGFSILSRDRSKDRLQVNMYGRRAFIKLLVDNKIWNDKKPHHLLGCSLAEEFSYPLYREINIETIDTSNPIVAGIKGYKYGSNGLTIKPSTKLCDLIDYKCSEEDMKLIQYNVGMFKEICHGNRWICFFSQTGSEINNLRKVLRRNPDYIITNKEYLLDVNEELLREVGHRIIQIKSKPLLEDYTNVLKTFNLRSDNTFITLHGYLRIIPAELCLKYHIYNLHPGYITKYPELKGFNPQEKAFRGGYKEAGVVIHEVSAGVDEGKVLVEDHIDIENFTLEDIYVQLHILATNLWTTFLRKLFHIK